MNIEHSASESCGNSMLIKCKSPKLISGYYVGIDCQASRRHYSSPPCSFTSPRSAREHSCSTGSVDTWRTNEELDSTDHCACASVFTVYVFLWFRLERWFVTFCLPSKRVCGWKSNVYAHWICTELLACACICLSVCACTWERFAIRNFRFCAITTG